MSIMPKDTTELLRRIREQADQLLPDDRKFDAKKVYDPGELLAFYVNQLDGLLFEKRGEVPAPWAHAKNSLVTPTEAAETLERIVGESYASAMSAEDKRLIAEAAVRLKAYEKKLGF